MKKKSWYKKWWGILSLLFLMLFLALLFAFSFAVIDIVKNSSKESVQNPENKVTDEARLKLIEGTSANYWLGSSNPKITTVEFSDFSCPHCRKSFSKVREISKKYKDIKLIFRDLPIVTDYSANLALAARCAGEQGLFWVMHDKLFINQGIKNDEALFELAKEAGVNEHRFESCFSTKKYFSDIEKDYQDAIALGANKGTPIWFINGEMASGDIPYDLFIEIIEKILEEENKGI